MSDQFKLFKYFSFLLGIVFVLCLSILGGFSFFKGVLLFGLLLLGVLLFKRPFLGLLILIVLRPAIDRIGTKLFLGGEVFSLNFNSLLGLLVLIWGGALIFQKRDEFKKLPALYLILLFNIFVFLSLFWSPFPIYSLREFLRIASIFVIYGTAFCLVKTKSQFKKIIYAFVASILIPLSTSLGQFFSGRGEVIFGEYFRRLYGSFFYPNSLAFFLVFIIAILLLLAYQANRRQERIFYGALGMLSFLVLLGTYARGAWLGVLVMFLIFGLFRFKKLLLAGAIFLASIYLFVPILQERIGDILRLEPFSSLMWRFRLWEKMIPFFYEKPFLGHGLSSFQILAQNLQGLSMLPVPEAHNDYLKLMIELGIVGLLIYLAIYLRLLIFNLKNYLKTKDKRLKDFSFLAVLLLGIFLLMALGDNILRGTATQWLLFSYLGGVASLTFKKQK